MTKLALALTLVACQGAAPRTSTTGEDLTSCVDLVASGDGSQPSIMTAVPYQPRMDRRVPEYFEAR